MAVSFYSQVGMEAVRLAGPLTKASLIHHRDPVVENVLRIEASVSLLDFSMSSKGPDELIVPEVCRYAHLEDEFSPSRKEPGWLSLIRSARFDVIVGADWDVERFFAVPVKETKYHVKRAVRISFPAFEHRGDVLSV